MAVPSTALQAQPDSDTLPKPSSEPCYDHWFRVRRFYIRGLRAQTRAIILILAMTYALERSPIQLVYAGRHGYPEPSEQDYGLIYCVAYMVSWIYLCGFFIVYIPLFSWWIPDTPTPSQTSYLSKIADILQKFNSIWLPFCVGFLLVLYSIFLVETFIYVEDRRGGGRSVWRKPKNCLKVWKIRGLLVAGVAISVAVGYGALEILRVMELARVKPLEYALCIIPIQINMGLMIGTKFQRKMEKKEAARSRGRFTPKVDEKADLLGVTVEREVPAQGAITL